MAVSRKKPFKKPPQTILEQIELLKSRGMVFSDEQSASRILEHNNYYRLGAYWLPYEADSITHRFHPGTLFDDVLRHSDFDCDLRRHISTATEIVEISLRSHWAYHMAHRHGAHSHLDSSLFDNTKDRWKHNLKKLSEEIQRSREIFINHFRMTYSESLPPVWVVTEVMTLGQLSRWYGSLKPKATRSAISRAYQVNESVFESWIQNISIVRNTCAHHARLWNREYTVTPAKPKNPELYRKICWVSGTRRIVNTLRILEYLLNIIIPGNTWYQDLEDLIDQYRINPFMIGYPKEGPACSP